MRGGGVVVLSNNKFYTDFVVFVSGVQFDYCSMQHGSHKPVAPLTLLTGFSRGSTILSKLAGTFLFFFFPQVGSAGPRKIITPNFACDSTG